MAVTVFLLLLPITGATYDFKTDKKLDRFTVETGAAETTGNVTLFQEVYDDDTSTIEITSSDSDDSPIYSSYNTTTRLLVFSGLDTSTNRTITIKYDMAAIVGTSGVLGALGTLYDYSPVIYYMMISILPIAGIAAIWVGKA